MKFEKLDSRRMRVTDIPSSVDGIRLGITEMEVIVAYSGDGSVRRGLAIDHCVMPLILAAPALLDACQQLLAAFKDTCNGWPARELHATPLEIVSIAEQAISQATEQEVNA